MLRWSNFRRLVKISQCSHNTVNFSATNVDIKASEQLQENKLKETEQSKLVAAAFASLKELSFPKKPRSSKSKDSDIINAKDINELLQTVEGPISRYHALKVVSRLADWANTGRVKLSDFETDIRFAKICRLLGQPGKGGDLGDLSLVLGVTAEDQAAKLISSISLPQMIKVMTSLGVQGKRSTPLLRSLSFNIGRSTETLDLKQASEVFYACTTLNFPDEVLLAKVTADIISSLKANQASYFVGSIVTSAGILKYRDTELLENVCNWMAENPSLCRVKDYISLVLSLAKVNYIPQNFKRVYQLLKPNLKEEEMANANIWLDVVWSLIVLQKYDENMISSVLCPEFITKLEQLQEGKIYIATKMKLLNINGVALQLGSSYEGPLLPKDSDVHDIPLSRTKEKQLLVSCVKDTLSNIVNVSDYFNLDVNSKMGFLIDFECLLNSESELIPLSKWSTEKGYKVAIMICNYHDVCRGGNEELNGITALNYRLLQNADYKLFMVPFYEFNPKDKFVSRVQYLENRLKNFISED